MHHSEPTQLSNVTGAPVHRKRCYGERICEHCQKSFTPGNPRAKVCCDACRVARHRAQANPTAEVARRNRQGIPRRRGCTASLRIPPDAVLEKLDGRIVSEGRSRTGRDVEPRVLVPVDPGEEARDARAWLERHRLQKTQRGEVIPA